MPPPVAVEGLGVDTHAATWLGVAVAERQRAAAVRAGLRPVASGGSEGDSHITLTPGCVASAGALRRFARSVSRRQTDAVGSIAGPAGRFAQDPALGDPACLVYLHGGGPLTAERLAAAERVEVSAPSRSWTLPALDPSTGKPAEIPLTDAILVPIQTYCGLLWANLLGLGPGLAGMLVVQRPLRAAVAVARGLRRGGSEHLLDALSSAATVVSRGARVHPTAVVRPATSVRAPPSGPAPLCATASWGPRLWWSPSLSWRPR